MLSNKIMCVTSDPLRRTAWCAARAACARPWWETLAWRRKSQITGQFNSLFIRTSLHTLWLDKPRSINYIPPLLSVSIVLFIFHAISLCAKNASPHSFSFFLLESLRWDTITHKIWGLLLTPCHRFFQNMQAHVVVNPPSPAPRALCGTIIINIVKCCFKEMEVGPTAAHLTEVVSVFNLTPSASSSLCLQLCL